MSIARLGASAAVALGGQDAVHDPRLAPPRWQPPEVRPWRSRAVLVLGLVLAVWYFGWLLHPDRVGHLGLYAALVVAELFNLTQAVGLWWTARPRRHRGRRFEDPGPVAVDVFIPVYDEPIDVVEPTIAAATRMRGAEVRVAVLDDGPRQELAAVAERYGARYVTRPDREGAKAGNINHALQHTDAPYVVILDCDHVPQERFLEATLGYFAAPEVAFVQTPQYYANADYTPISEAAWSQQALFFGPIARAKDSLDSMFVCGTNVVLRREALEEVGGFPQDSVTEDFELSLRFEEAGYHGAYVPEVLASGLGPEDLASYLGQQLRWARGCIGALPNALRSRLPLRHKLQYLLSASFFLTGWTVLLYVSLPAIRILTGAQPLAHDIADQFLIHFIPYFGLALLAVAAFGVGTYRFSAYTLMVSSFWVHVKATLAAISGRAARFTVTPKRGQLRRQIRPALIPLTVAGLLGAAIVYGLARDRSPATLNNVAFALLHVTVLTAGVWPAITAAGARTRAPYLVGPVPEVLRAGPPARPEVDVVVLSWNRVDATCQTIASALEQRDVEPTVWVVDQGSEPTQLRRLHAQLGDDPRVRVIEVGRNLGVPGGRNLGMRQGRAPGSCASTTTRSWRRPTPCGTSSTASSTTPRWVHWHSGRSNTRPAEPDETTWAYPDRLRSWRDAAFVTARFVGVGHAIRREALTQVGDYDERLFFCEEELDLSYKLIAAGYRIVYDAAVTVRHQVDPERRVHWEAGRFRLQVRNAVYLHFRHHRGLIATTMLAGGWVVRGARNGLLREALRGACGGPSPSPGSPDGEIRADRGLGTAGRAYVWEHDGRFRGSLVQRVRGEALAPLPQHRRAESVDRSAA
jgi:cellulose synthase (UDP-forming)